MPNRYCYIIRSAEKDIVGVFTGRSESNDEAMAWAFIQGAVSALIEQINDEITVISCKGGTPCKVWVERHRLK